MYNGNYGIELSYNFSMQTLYNETIQRLNKEFNKSVQLKANSLILTLDKNLQEYCYKKLGSKTGSIIVMDNSTGKILSMVSYPNFSPSSIEDTWEYLNSDYKNNPFLNRATQGLYTPSSIFKIITTITFMESYPDWQEYTYKCKGYEVFNNVKINCINNTAHGEINLKEALSASCNTFFANLSNIIEPNKIAEKSEKLLFNKPLNFPLEYKMSSFKLNNSSPRDEIIQTYIGEGNTLITPLHMVLIGNALANNGVIMSPYIVDKEINYKGNTINKNMPKKLATVFSCENANMVKDFLKIMFDESKNIKLDIPNLSVSGNTGIFKINGEKKHMWFLGISPVENPNVIISIVIENPDENNIIEIAKDILIKALNIN